jgi:hypothetical protein
VAIRTGGDPDAITLFKSLGIGLEDLAIASLVYDRAVASGRCEARPAKDCKRNCRYWPDAEIPRCPLSRRYRGHTDIKRPLTRGTPIYEHTP